MAITIQAQNTSSAQFRAEAAQRAAELAAEAGATTSLAVSGNATVAGTLAVTGHVGFNGQSPVGKSAAYTKTYSTAARTIPNATAANVVTTTPALTSYGFTQAQAEEVLTAINATQADVLALKKLIVALVVDLEAVGIAG